MTGCRRYRRDAIIEYLEGCLTDEVKRREFEEHLKTCRFCQKEYQGLQGLYRLLDKDGVRLPDPEIFERMKTRVRQEELILGRQPVFKALKILIPVCAAAVIVFVLFRQPARTMDVSVPISSLLEDRDVAAYALNNVVNDDLKRQFLEIEDGLPLEINDAIDELTDEERDEFIKMLYDKYGSDI
jgi:hypothetical protein